MLHHIRIDRVLAILCALSLAAIAMPSQSSPAVPGARPAGFSPQAPQQVDSIIPYYVDTGPIDVSIDAMGTLEVSGIVQAYKPNEYTAVRKAFLLAATTGFYYYNDGPLADGEMLLNGFPVNWSLISESSIYSYNHLADVTTQVAIDYALAPPGYVDFIVAEADTYRVDGVVLVVVYHDFLQEHTNTIAFSFGAQNVSGDSFSLTFDEPIDVNDPELVLEMSLGISYGAQGCAYGQYSELDVNGIRLSSSAGGEDDGVCSNGALITAGGIGDSNQNPADPFNTDNGNPRQDDELYDLRPFVSDGDTQIVVNTLNPSADDNIFMAVFRVSKAAVVSTEPKRPVIFIPGFGGSRLNEGDEEIWPGITRLINRNDDEHLNALIPTEEGLDPDGSNISVGDDIVRRIALIYDVYDSTVNRLEDLGYEEDVDLFVFPYDFRKDIRTTAQVLEAFIRQKTGGELRGVDLIAHSQGGLVTKQCILTSSCAELVSNAAILGTPFAGTPGVVKLLEYGERLPGNWLGYLIGVSPNRSRIISQNWPNVYQLIPGPNYYQLYGDGYFIYDHDLDGDGDLEGRMDYATMKAFLSSRHNAGLVELGETFQHDGGVDSWLGGTNGVNVVVFAGSGLPTLTEIRDYNLRIGPISIRRQDFREHDTGDETVTVNSVALNNRQGVDFTGGNVHVFYMDRMKHGELPKNSQVLQFVATIFAHTPSQASRLSSSQELPPPPEDILTEPTFVNGRQFLFNGEIEVEVIDEQGNRTGKGEDDLIAVGALGASYTEIGDAVSIFVYGSGTYTFTIGSEAVAAFDLRARSVEESAENRQVLFAGIGLEENAAARLVFDASDPGHADVLEIDQDGDGSFETSVTPDGDISGDDLADATPPVTSILLEGVQRGDRYLGRVLVSLAAEDNQGGSGLAKIFYSLDNGATLQEYTAPFVVSQPGVTEILALSVDQAGNYEPVARSQIVDILAVLYLPVQNR